MLGYIITMENVFNFSDGLFLNSDGNEDNSAKKLIPLNPNFLKPLWFRDVENCDDSQILKFRGDNLYFNKEFEAALNVYEKCLTLIPSTNQTLIRDTVESCIWCHMKLGDFKKACSSIKQFKDNLLSTFGMPEQHTPAYFVEYHLSRCLENQSDKIFSINQLLAVHDQDASLWLELGILYTDKMWETQTPDLSICKHNQVFTKKGLNCDVLPLDLKHKACDCFSKAVKLAVYHQSISTSFYKTYYNNIVDIAQKYIQILNIKL